MDLYARFKKDMKADNNNVVVFKENIAKSKKRRYAIIDEDSDYLYVANVPNDIQCTTVVKFEKGIVEEFFDIVNE